MEFNLDILAWLIIGSMFSFGLVPAFVDMLSYDNPGYWECFLKGHALLVVLALVSGAALSVMWAASHLLAG